MRFGILGPLEVIDDDGPRDVAGAKCRALLALLLVHANEVLAADRLAEDLWEGNPPPSSRATLQTYISQLRRALGAPFLRTRAGGYVLELAADQLDVFRFEAVLRDVAARPDLPPDRIVRRLDDGLNMWRGRALAAFESAAWARAESSRLEELRLGALLDRNDAYLDLGHHAMLVAALESLVADHPLQERIWAQLMLALYRSDRQAEALRAYGRLRTRLGDELGIDPSVELVRLEEAILLQKPELEWRSPARAALTVDDDRDFRRLETSPRHAVGNLPSSRTEFIGRSDDLTKVRKLLSRSRIVTLTGTGGVGKTRLALQVAASLATTYDDGAWFVDLAPVANASSVVPAVASALQLSDGPASSTDDAVIAGTQNIRALVVMDNCEHVIDGAAQVADLLTQQSPHITIIATSREPLRVEGETTLVVEPLGVPSAPTHAPADLLASDAVRLFVDRAMNVDQTFTLTSVNGAHVVGVCRRLDGLPLAIELAAARMQSMGLDAIANHLDERFQLLTRGLRTVSPRQQTLRATVDWSYDLLEPVERLVFARLSVFAGGFSLAAAETVASGGGVDGQDIVNVVSDLATKSMIAADPSEAPLRYRMLETLREYGAERLGECDDTERVRANHAEYFARVANAACSELFGPDDAVWTQQLHADRENLNAALIWARDRDPSMLLRLTESLAPYWRHQSQFRDCIFWTEAALAAEPEASPPIRAEIAAQAAWAATNLSQPERAHALLRDSLDASDVIGEQPVAFAFLTRALDALLSNRPRDAQAHVEEAMKRARARGPRYAETECITHAAIVVSLTSGGSRAVELADEALDIARSSRNRFLLGLALEAAGIAHCRSDPAKAIALLDESMLIATQGSSIDDQAQFFRGIACFRLGRYRAAAASFDQALIRHRATGAAEYYQSICLAAIAALLERSGAFTTAIVLLASVERLRDEDHIVGAAIDLEGQQSLRRRLASHCDRELFEQQWANGRALTLDQAVDLARTAMRSVTDPTESDAPPAGAPDLKPPHPFEA